MRIDDRGPHLDDGDLFRLTDGACSDHEVLASRRHLESCPSCTSRAAEVEAQSKGLSELVTRAGPIRATAARTNVRALAPNYRPRLWRSRRAIGIAAGILLLLTGGLVVSPARAWLTSRWAQLTSSQQTPPEDERGLASTALVPERAAIAFRPPGPHVVVEIVNHQADGTLRIVVEPGDSVVASIHGGEGTEEFVLLTDGVRIANPESSTAIYVVRLPPVFSSVSVVVAGQEVDRLVIQPGGPPISREFVLRRERAPIRDAPRPYPLAWDSMPAPCSLFQETTREERCREQE